MGQHSLIPLPFTEKQTRSFVTKTPNDRRIFTDPLPLLRKCAPGVSGAWVGGEVYYAGNNFLLFWDS